jgi:hypothetical protein
MLAGRLPIPEYFQTPGDHAEPGLEALAGVWT